MSKKTKLPKDRFDKLKAKMKKKLPSLTVDALIGSTENSFTGEEIEARLNAFIAEQS